MFALGKLPNTIDNLVNSLVFRLAPFLCRPSSLNLQSIGNCSVDNKRGKQKYVMTDGYDSFNTAGTRSLAKHFRRPRTTASGAGLNPRKSLSTVLGK